MAEGQTTREKQTAEDAAPRGSKASSAAAEEEVLTVPVDDLIARSSDFLGHPSHVTAAALHGRVADMSLEDAHQRVSAFLEREHVKTKEA